MEKMIIRKFDDFEEIINKLKENKSVMIELNELDDKLKIRIIDLVVGYIYDRGVLKKESATSYIISLGK